MTEQMNLFADAPEVPVWSDATIDQTGRYRYNLIRCWDGARPRVCFVMLNPSTADASQDDPTIRRCIGFAKGWGYGSLEVVNLFAFRATAPDEMKAAADAVGPLNDYYIGIASRRAARVIAAWGVHGEHKGRDAEVRSLLSLDRLYYLGLAKDGHPRHPLYVRADVEPGSWPAGKGLLGGAE